MIQMKRDFLLIEIQHVEELIGKRRKEADRNIELIGKYERRLDKLKEEFKNG